MFRYVRSATVQVTFTVINRQRLIRFTTLNASFCSPKRFPHLRMVSLVKFAVKSLNSCTFTGHKNPAFGVASYADVKNSYILVGKLHHFLVSPSPTMRTLACPPTGSGTGSVHVFLVKKDISASEVLSNAHKHAITDIANSLDSTRPTEWCSWYVLLSFQLTFGCESEVRASCADSNNVNL